MKCKNIILRIMSYASKRSHLIIPFFSNRFENKSLTCMGTWLTDVLTLHFYTCTLKINTTSKKYFRLCNGVFSLENDDLQINIKTGTS